MGVKYSRKNLNVRTSPKRNSWYLDKDISWMRFYTVKIIKLNRAYFKMVFGKSQKPTTFMTLKIQGESTFLQYNILVIWKIIGSHWYFS